MRCCVCQRFGEVQNSPTTAHHPIHDRYSTRKRSDGEAIPLCEGHHQGLWDNSKIAIHKEPKLWQETYGLIGPILSKIQTHKRLALYPGDNKPFSINAGYLFI